MRKVCFAEFGDPDVLQLVDAEEPHASPGRIRIAVRAAGVNPVDWRIREGRILGAHPIKLPSGVGLDASGVVDEVGEGVEGVEVGDHMFGEGWSTYAEFAVLSVRTGHTRRRRRTRAALVVGPERGCARYLGLGEPPADAFGPAGRPHGQDVWLHQPDRVM